MATLVKMPKWGLTMTAGTVTDWLADEGGEVSAGAPLLTVETEKAVNDVEAPADGVLLKIVASTGTEVPVSGPVAVIAAPGEALTDEEIAALIAAAAPTVVDGVPRAGGARAGREARAAARDAGGRVNASPAARKRAGELGINLGTVTATGPGGRITSEDVERAAAEAGSGADGGVVEDAVTLPDGRRIAYLIAGPREGTPLVFLHGLGGARGTWDGVLGGLVDHWRVCALDLPGHGGSDKGKPGEVDYSVTGLATAVADAVEGLGLGSVVLVGHSLGAATALAMALARPGMVRGLMLVNAAGLGAEVNPALLDRVEAEPDRAGVRALLELFYEDGRLVTERGVEEMLGGWTATGAMAAIRAAAAASFGREGQRIGFRERLGEVGVPTLVVWGERDRVFSLDHAVEAARRLPDGWLKVLPGIGHVPQIEAPEAFGRAVDRFARTLAG